MTTIVNILLCIVTKALHPFTNFTQPNTVIFIFLSYILGANQFSGDRLLIIRVRVAKVDALNWAIASSLSSFSLCTYFINQTYDLALQFLDNQRILSNTRSRLVMY